MAIVVHNKSNLIICSNTKILLFDTGKGSSREVSVPAVCIPANLTKNQEDAIRNERSEIVSCCFSKCGSYFAVCAKNKQLVVYDSGFNVLKNIIVQRAVSKVRFTPSGDIVIADKTGDVYLFRLKDDSLTQLLGHLSMVLDVLVSDCEKYIVTCDRDEKIRTSRFPGSYNIVDYCLGHEEFVLNMEFYGGNVLISSSGDGTVRLWDYIAGKQLGVVNTNDYIEDKMLVQKFTETMDSETVEVNALPITSMKVHKFNDFTVIIVSLHTLNALQVYRLSDELQINFVKNIKFDSNIISFELDDRLYVLTNDDIQIFEYANDFRRIHIAGLEELFAMFKQSLGEKSDTETISILYKRKYDNMQEYQQRKKLRIESKNK